MARSLLHTFSDSKYFEDRRGKGYAVPITERINSHSRPIVSYYFPKGVGEHHYGERHPMKPHRLTLTNALVMGYGLDKQIHNLYSPRAATQAELEVYHDHDYVDFLSRVAPGNQSEMKSLIDSFNCVEDCPIFGDMYDFCKMYAGASLAAARKLCAGTTDIAINWSGGLHHAKRGEASGFCYVNDIVLAILELLRCHPRVLYIDIDIHHGDGVELAFWNSNRVMTVSFHKYTGDFFPGTGRLDDNGGGLGKHFCLNVPLLDGIDDTSYVEIFQSVIGDTVSSFRPSAIVLQCGADSLGCDRLGAFNLSIAAHGECVNFVRKFNVPMLVLGGGGYTVHNVSRCWTYETSVLVGAELSDELPITPYDAWFADDYTLHPAIVGKVENANTPASLQRLTTSIRQKLRYLQGAPSVQMQEIPPNLAGWLESEEKKDEEKREDRGTAEAGEFRIDPSKAQNEFYDDEIDVDKDDDVGSVVNNENPVVATPTRGRGTTTPRRARGGRRGRGRGRGAATAASTPAPTIGSSAATPDPDADMLSGATAGDISTQVATPTPTRGRGRGRGRGRRGRGRGAAARAQSGAAAAAKEKEKEKEKEQQEVDGEDAEMAEGAGVRNAETSAGDEGGGEGNGDIVAISDVAHLNGANVQKEADRQPESQPLEGSVGSEAVIEG